MNNNRKFWLPVIAAISVTYVVFRFWNLTDSCLWFDEIFGVHAAGHSWKNLFWFVAQDLIHPPLFYVLLKIWILIGGESLFWLRFFPVFFSILALVPLYFLCRQLKLNYLTIALAFLLFATNGALIKYAQEVRMYSLLLFLSLLSMWLFSRFLHLGKNIWILSIVNVLLVYTHYFGWFVVLAEIGAILFLQRIKIGQILIMFGICLLSFLPWIFVLFRAVQVNADVGQNIGWMSRPNLAALFQFAIDVVEPFYYQASSVESASIYLVSVPLLILIGAAKIFNLSEWQKKDASDRQNFYLLAIFTALPILIALFASLILPYSIWGTRHLITVFAPMLILAAIFLTDIKIRWLKIAFLSLLVGLTAIAFVFQIRRETPRYVWCGWENLAQTIDTNQPAKIYVFEDLIAYHFWFALRDSDQVQVIKINNLEGIREDKAYFLPRGFENVKIADDFKDERFWVAFSQTEWNLQKPPLQNLVSRGYKIGEPKVFKAQGLNAYLVEVSK